jgi:hypothetical protein
MKAAFHTLFGLLLLAEPAGLHAQTYIGNDFDYAVNADGYTLTITGYSGSGGAVAIPTVIDGYQVTAIGDGDAVFGSGSGVTSVTIPPSITSIGQSAFSGGGLTSVTIPGSVMSIGAYAFSACDSLTNATISNGIMNIGEEAFYRCWSLTSVTIPASVTSIGADAFMSCWSMTAITVDEQNSIYSSVDGVLFDKSGTSLIEAPAGLGGRYTVPGGATSIGQDAFAWCPYLTEVTMLNGVTSIAGGAFSECEFLTNVVIPSSVTSIGEYAFYNCNWLTSLTIPGSVTTINEYAFFACALLNSVFFGGNAPAAGSTLFLGDSSPSGSVTVYYLPGTTGWSNTFAGKPTALWQLPQPTILNNGPNFGIQSNTFGFTISWATNSSVVVEASANLASPVWTPLQTNTLTNGSFYFSEPLQTNGTGRYYRISSS